MLSVQNITYRLKGRILLDDLSFQLSNGIKAGLLGRNGSGKTTLFRLILGQISPDSGKIMIPKDYKILTVAQDVPGGEQTLLEYLLASDQLRDSLMKAVETCTDPNILGDLYDQLIQMDAYTAEGRASIILKGLGFSEEQQNSSLSSFSGGFRMRVALGAALFQEPDLLMLDEPTNHLDLEAIIWLKSFIKNYKKSILIISHDRDLMNECVDTIFHLNQGKITRYNGNLDFYLETYAQQKASLVATNSKLQAQRAHMQAFVDRFKAKASKARQAQSRMKALAKMKPLDAIVDDPSIKIRFSEVEDLSPPLIQYEKVSLGYGEKVILKNLSGLILQDDRIALLGANGRGKSTFAKFLAGRLNPLKGTLQKNSKLRVGFFHQHQLEELNPEESAFAHIHEKWKDGAETQIRAYLGQFGFSNEKAFTKAKDLSGGEKVRLNFALIALPKPHILILDEPTNHLDMEMRESLIMALNDFNGAIIIIAHDWHLLSHVVDRLWVVGNQTIKTYEGSLDEYKADLYNAFK